MADHGVANWAAQPDDLIQNIGDIYLSTDNLDYYAALRAVCGAWRCATPQEHFTLSKWIIFEHYMSGDDLVDDAATLLNMSTRRFVEKKIPRLIRRGFFSAYMFNFVDLLS
jgi:nucleoside phosphorylase